LNDHKRLKALTRDARARLRSALKWNAKNPKCRPIDCEFWRVLHAHANSAVRAIEAGDTEAARRWQKRIDEHFEAELR
jgi:hypothetical protein